MSMAAFHCRITVVGTGIYQVQTNSFCLSIFKAGQRSLGPSVERPGDLLQRRKPQSRSSAADGQVDLGICERALITTCSPEILLRKLNVLMLIECPCLDHIRYFLNALSTLSSFGLAFAHWMLPATPCLTAQPPLPHSTNTAGSEPQPPGTSVSGKRLLLHLDCAKCWRLC